MRFPFPELPSGWYVAALSSEVKPRGLLSRRYFEREIVIYRGESGALRVIDAFCPHMGGHLGKLGRVEGDELRCGFHGFRYDGSGRCVETAYGGPPPSRAQLDLWEVREQNGLILVWFDPLGRAPEWEVPALEDDGWNRIRGRRFQIATHPQETTENSVDLGHFTQVHGFVDGQITSQVRTEGPLLTTAYRAYHPLHLPGLRPIPVDYAVKVWGLGYSQVDVEVRPLGLELRVWVLPIPRDQENIDLVIGASTKKKLGPLGTLARLVAHRMVCSEVEQDLDVWTYKTFLPQPALAKGDGPIAEYRRWAGQFYAPS